MLLYPQQETLTAHRDRQRAKAEIQKLRTDYLIQQRRTYPQREALAAALDKE